MKIIHSTLLPKEGLWQSNTGQHQHAEEAESTELLCYQLMVAGTMGMSQTIPTQA